MRVAVLFATGTEELEALTPVDVLRRANVDCDIVSVSGQMPVGSHNICVKEDFVIEKVDLADYDAIVIPGGMPGAVNISQNKKALGGIKNAIDSGKIVASICASPAVVLAKNGLINGKKATCYPAPQFVSELGENYTGADVQTCGNLITANGPKSAFKFALEICNALKVKPNF